MNSTKPIRRSTLGLLVLALAGALGTAAAAQSTVSSAEILRLEDSIYDASRDVSQLRSRDASAGTALQDELDDARD